MTVALGDGVVMRLVTEGDAQALTDAYARNHEHLHRWEPRRPKGFFTLAGQSERVRLQLELHAEGRLMPWVLADGDLVVGAFNLSNIVYGPFQSGNLGYWVDAGYAGRGLATRAALEVCREAGGRLGLHRIEAGTLLDNAASQRVLRKAGFEPFGIAPRYLAINGKWRDHRLFQRILHNRPPIS
ncbi:GNAT family N-acetyltransferase [Nonomuraea muscovyensis]|uniref:Ribosomal-protein-alanine N-acetyltransferase n=1 Tax=Nonomuraea muscovyensis TaxID=1124761 RepID=A0A7X0BZ83_9ACTN|nr:GNAT family N-acetyltransferase [Nonomuraea muscovyensis]MBB6345457.1 ribosomal-protein-alanine N-acetyltransferase [Nonomuraea muscovyensis]MDF2711959.1 alanine acetyltransferase [Nonomuraea muscovyensis]